MAPQGMKQELFGDDDLNPFSMSYASMAGIDVSLAQSYQDVAAYVSTQPQRPEFQRSHTYPNAYPGYTG